MPRLTKVNINHFYIKDGRSTLATRTFDFSKINMKRRMIKYKQIIKDKFNGLDDQAVHKRFGLPLPINNCCKFIGIIRGSYKYYSTDKRGAYEPRYELNNLIEKFYEHSELVTSDGAVEKVRQIYPGDFKYSSWNIEQMAIPNKGYSYDDLLSGLESRIGLDLQLPYIGTFVPEAIQLIGVNPKASSGYRTSRYIAKKRSKSTNQSKQYAKKYQEMMMKSDFPIVDRSLQEIGGREKLVKNNFEEGKRLKTRVTLQMEDIPTLIGQNLVTQINPKLQEINDGFNWGGVINGRLNSFNLHERLKSDAVDTINSCLDYDTHDSRILEETLVVGMGITRIMFDESEELDRLFYYVLSSMIYKRVVIPDCGMIFELSKGLSTGHPFTSIMNTLCAYLTLSVSINKACTKTEISKTWITNAGDDTVCKLPLNKLNSINNYMQNFSGMKMSDLSVKSGLLTTTNLHRKISFLKYIWMYGLFSWNHIELFQNFVFPTTRSRSLSRQVDRMKFFTIMAPFDLVIQELVKSSILILGYSYMKFKVPWKLLEHHNRLNFSKILMSSWREQVIERFKDAPPSATLAPNWWTYNALEQMNKYVESVDKQARISRSWMMEWRPFKLTEDRVRLKIFDKGKAYIPIDNNFSVKVLDWKYEVRIKSLLNDNDAFRSCSIL